MPKLRKRPEELREFNLSACLKKAMIDKGLKNQHLAKLLGMNSGQLSRVINHPLHCNIKTLLKVSDKLGVALLNTDA